MVDNSTNINKTNNHFSPQISADGNSHHFLGQAQKCDRVKPVNGNSSLPLNTITTKNHMKRKWLL